MTTAATDNKSKARTRDGMVVSNKMQKTIIVEVTRLIEHPQFKKVIKRKVRYAAHDEKNTAKIGDKVRIQETRPISKSKRWRLVEVLA
jgi:small subunit ribosomal protein S17